MRPDVFRIDATGADADAGRVVWAPTKSLWNSSLLAIALIAAPLTMSFDTVLVCITLTYATLLLGHSVGLHRLIIHRAFDTPRWLARTLAYLGVLVGMAGPFGTMKIHDVRDWAQREARCHDFFAHRRSLWRDAIWQLHCQFEFERPPRFTVESRYADDWFFIWLERTWMLQQLPLAGVLYLLGGLPWVVWGVAVRVVISVTGHWVVTYYTHNPGPGRWSVRGAGVQAANLRGVGFITMGECWHNNHHAFPESAKIGLEPGQTDPAWWIIRGLERVGLAQNIGEPRPSCTWEDIEQISGWPAPQRVRQVCETPITSVRAEVRLPERRSSRMTDPACLESTAGSTDTRPLRNTHTDR